MSDENGRDRGRHDRETDEFGGPLFPEGSGSPHDHPTEAVEEVESGPISFGPNDTGSLPHWTDPPTGEIPRVEPTPDPSGGLDEDIDVWSSFTTESPVWREDLAEEADSTGQMSAPNPTGSPGHSDSSGGFDRPRDPSGGFDRPGDVSGGFDRPRDPSGPVRRTDVTGPVSQQRREPARIQIGTDPSGVQRRPAPQTGRARAGTAKRRGSPTTASGPRRTSPTSNRDMPAAIIAAVVLAGAFIGATLWRPAAVIGIIVVVLALASYEYLAKVTEKGYRPVVAVGVLACVAAPLAAYWMGEFALPLVIAFAFMATTISFIGANGVESGPLPNTAITTMGVVWIGLLGSYAALIVRWSTAAGENNIGTDTLLLLTLGVAANDIGALFVGSATGKTPLRSWISPGKTLEGLIGGTLLTIAALVVVGIVDLSDTWNDTPELILLGVVISVMAPLGDLAESMFKRNLDVKDFGSLVAGHGGLLDRFDGFLFVLPAVYYLGRMLEPWLSR
jgi:phosphatidate cytidylyltransferase